MNWRYSDKVNRKYLSFFLFGQRAYSPWSWLLKRILWASFLRIPFLPLSTPSSLSLKFLHNSAFSKLWENAGSEDERSGGRPIKSLSCSTLSDDLEEVEHIVHSWRNTSYTTTVRNVTNQRRLCFVNKIQIEVTQICAPCQKIGGSTHEWSWLCSLCVKYLSDSIWYWDHTPVMSGWYSGGYLVTRILRCKPR
jgi:hypothetical protein